MTQSALQDTEQTPGDSVDFQREATEVLQELRPALAEIVERVEPRVARAADLRRRLNLSQKLTWSVFTAATSRDVRTLPSLLPGKVGMERFFEAAERAGVPADVIARARLAFEQFEATVARHASSRDIFGTMVAELNGGGGDEAQAGGVEVKHKRAAYRANVLLWGQKAELSCGIRIVGPGAAPDLVDSVVVSGIVGLQRTRPGVSLGTTERRWTSSMPGGPPEPLVPEAAGDTTIGLLPEFCSQPLPEFRPCELDTDYRRFELLGDKLGASGEVTFFTAEVSRGAPASGLEVIQTRGVAMPTALYIGDVLVHRSRCNATPPQVQIYAWPLDGHRSFRQLLPLTETSEYLGEGIDVARTPRIPRYAQLLSYVMERMHWRADEFRVFRVQVEYPLLHTGIKTVLRCPP